ncbi:MAG: hypothetical protein ACRC8S_09260 [Fimbriiglobus sp.]
MAWGWWNVGDEPPIAGVAIASTGQGNTHVGVVYRAGDDSETLGFIHLAFHCLLQVEVPFAIPSRHYLCIVPKVPKSMLEAVATRCRQTAVSQPELKYGFRWQRDARFDEAGHYLVLDDRGMNCSTFTLTIFRSVQVKLVDEDTWQTRPEDELRFHELWSYVLGYVQRRFREHPATLELHEQFLTRIAPDVNSIRIRPEETAGACLSPSLPVGFEACQVLGQGVLARVSQMPELQ